METKSGGELKSEIFSLEKKIDEMNSDFGKQRTKSLNIILSAESENKLLKDQIDTLIAEQRINLLEIAKLKEEQSNVSCILQASQSMEQNQLATVKQNYEQEIASLKQAYTLQIQDYREQLQIFFNERNKSINERDNLIKQINERDNLTKKNNESNNNSNNSSNENTKIISPSQPKQSLEDEMNKALKESVLLKEVVVPMEQEIETLKVKLEEANRKLLCNNMTSLQIQSPDHLAPITDLIRLDDSNEEQYEVQSDPFMKTILGTANDSLLQINNDYKYEYIYDNADVGDEIGGISDLTSLGVVQAVLDISKDNSELYSRKDLQDSIIQLEVKLKSYEQKNEEMSDLYDEVLTTKNQLFEKNFSLTDHLTKLTRELQRERKHLFVAKKLIDATRAPGEAYVQPNGINDEEWKIFREKLENIELTENLNPFNNSNEDTTNNNDNNVNNNDNSKNDNNNNNNDNNNNNNNNNNNSSISSIDELPDSVEKLREELIKCNKKNEILSRANKSLNDKLKQSESDTSTISEADPQSIFSKQLTLLKTNCDQLKLSNEKEKRLREEMRKTFKSQQSELEKLKVEYESKDVAMKELFNDIKEEFIDTKKDAQAQVAALVDDREKLVSKNREFENKYAQLKTQRKGEMSDYNHRLNEEIFQKTEAERNVATLQSQLDNVLEDKKLTEEAQNAKVESLMTILNQYESQKNAEQAKHSIEVKDLTDKVSDKNQLTTQIEIMQKTKNELLNENTLLNDSMVSLKRADNLEINELKQSVKMLKDVNSKLDGRVADQERQLSKLKNDLNVSQEVQKDFVTMTQQLQIQVINFEEERKMIKWESEEDIEKCYKCNQKFTEVRTKSRCKRCCLILCNDCTKWTAQTAKNREVSVCENCHTMLVSGSQAIVSKANPSSLMYSKN